MLQMREHMRRLHMEMIRQLHLQQVEFLGAIEEVSNRQESLVGRIDQVGVQVQKLLHMKESMLLM